MSSRQLRKLQQQKELEEANRILQEEAEAEEESDDEPISKTPPKSKPAFSFAALNEEEDEEEEKEDSPPEQSESEAEPAPTPAPQAKKSKNKKKKKKAKAKAVQKPESDSEDIDAALRELSLKAPSVLPTGDTAKAASDRQLERICALLAVQTQHLKVGNEMRTLFGRAATDNHDEAGGRARGGRAQPMDLEAVLKGRHARGKGLSEITLRRNLLIQGKDDWPVGTTGGLSMELHDDMRQSNGTVEFRFVHDNEYQKLQTAFYALVEMGDPQNLIGFLTKNPYHISCLIQVSKIAKDQGDHALSSDLLERALFTFGRAGLSLFNTMLTEGKARFDFRRPENRELWLAGYQYIKSLVMKGTYRTAFEWAKLLLSLDPEDDPYCMRLMIHYLALKSHQFSWLLEISDIQLEKEDIPIYNKDKYDTYHNTPSLAFAALQLRDQVKCRDLLQRSMQRLPWVFVRLFQEINLDAPPTIWGIEPRTKAENLFTSIYVQQTKDLWNTPEATALLMEIAHTIPKVDERSIPKVNDDERTLDVVRFVYLDNTPALMALVPSQMLHKSNNSDSDPIPPDKNIFSYQAQRQALEENEQPGMGFGDHFNPLAGLHRLMMHQPRGTDDDFDEDDEDDVQMERMRQVLEADSDEEIPGVPPPGFVRRVVQMLWRTSGLGGDEEGGEATDGTDTDIDMPVLIREELGLSEDEGDAGMPGLVDIDDDEEEMPGLVAIDSDEEDMPGVVPANSTGGHRDG